MKSKLFYTQMFGVLLLLLLILIVVPIYMQRIPTVLVERIDTKLKSQGIDWVSIRAEGRDIILSGVAPTIELHQEAVRLTKEVAGVHRVNDKISPIVITPYRMDINYNGKELTLQGYFPSKEGKVELLRALNKVYQGRVIDKIDIGAGEPPHWELLNKVLMTHLKPMSLAAVNIVGKKLHISGKIASWEEKEKITEALNVFTKHGYTVHNHIVSLDEAMQVCQNKFNTLLREEKFEFESGKSVLKEKNRQLLQALSDIALLCPGSKIEVIGHTDNRGNHQQNMDLSLERAKVVVAKLFSLGVSFERLDARGAGESAPIATNETDEGRAKNRRIEFKVIGN